MKSIFQNRWVVWTLEILFFVLLYMLLRAYTQQDMVQGQAPDIQATTLNQQSFVLHHAEPKPILLHFWATWCGICKMEQDSIEALSKDYNVMTVAMQSGSDHEIKSYLDKHDLSFEVINDVSGEFVERYGITGVPASFVIDSNNEIVAREIGYTTPIGLRIRLVTAK